MRALALERGVWQLLHLLCHCINEQQSVEVWETPEIVPEGQQESQQPAEHQLQTRYLARKMKPLRITESNDCTCQERTFQATWEHWRAPAASRQSQNTKQKQKFGSLLTLPPTITPHPPLLLAVSSYSHQECRDTILFKENTCLLKGHAYCCHTIIASKKSWYFWVFLFSLRHS